MFGKFKIHFVFLVLFLLPVLNSCNRNSKDELINSEQTDLNHIISTRRIVFATSASNINYFIYKSQAMGFQLELIQRYAQFLGVDYEIKVYKDINTAIDWLQKGECDIIADELMICGNSDLDVEYCTPLFHNNLVLVQRKPENYDTLTKRELSDTLIRKPSELKSKQVIIPQTCFFGNKSGLLRNKIEQLIDIKEDSLSTQEDLIRKVAEGKANYTISHESIAKVGAMLYPHLDVKTKLGYSFYSGWMVSRNTPKLKESVNYWLGLFQNRSQYRQLFRKYYKNSAIAEYSKSIYHSANKGKLSDYDAIFYKYGKVIGWDWRLLASLAYQESNFRSNTVSPRGAFGLMQLMPGSAAEFNVDSTSPPSENVRAGVSLIKQIDGQIPKYIKDPDERKKFILASYNIGFGHIIDAIRLAKKYKKDHTRWSWNVSVFLKKKAHPKYYNDPVVRNGPSKGFETCNLVDEVWYRYMHYRNLLSITPKS